ncbi:MAG: protein kinase [Desulfobulbaceae bacterium]|nr:protein kinase [Desulfobulbaceae bacterium]
MTTFQARQLGKYILLDQLAVGGMAELFRAMITSVQGFEKLIAIKKILPHLASEEDLVSSFIDEAKLAALLHHQNIVQIYDFGSLDDSYFIAMEYLLGKDCRTICSKAKEKNIPIEPQNALLIVSRICAGLDYAHKLKDFQGKPLNIIHRDISPQNILITYEGDVKIVDFGIAKAASQNTRTQMGMIKGKVAYMSPEQAGGKSIDHRSDIFSCGIILYEMLTGKRMFSGDTLHILSKVRDADFVKPEELQIELPAKLFEVFDRALKKDPNERYQSCGEMLNDLEECMQQGSHPTTQGLSKYMKTLFAEEIVAEEQHLKQITQIGLMKGKQETPPSSPPPEQNQPETKTSAPPESPIKKEAEKPSSSPVETSKSKKPLLAAAAGGILVLIVLIVVMTRNGEEPSPPPEQTPVASQVVDEAPPVEKTEEPVVAADTETPGTETYQKAMDALVEKRYDEATSLFEELLQLGPGMKEKIATPYAEALVGQADTLRETDTQQSISLLRKSIKLDPENEQAHFQLGTVLMKENDYAGAIESYENVIELDPNFPDTFFNLGFIYALSKDYNRAEEMYSRVVELAPDYLDEALFNLALVQSKLDKKDESLANLEQAVKINPNNELAQSYLQKMKEVSGETL